MFESRCLGKIVGAPSVPPFTGWWFQDSSLDLDFLNDRAFEATPSGSVYDMLSCSRASSGYAQTAAGTLTSFSSNQLRITDLGLLVEDARLNDCPSSQVFTSTWINAGAITKADNQTAAPDGTTTAGKLTDDATNQRHGIIINSGGQAGNPVTASCYVKDGGRRYVAITCADSGSGASNGGAVFDLQTGTFTASDGPNYLSSGIESLANGWYRIWVVVTSATNIVIGIGLSGSATPTFGSGSMPTYLGNGSFAYFWGAQTEYASFPSSYIPTSGASATRAADDITMIGSLNANLLAPSASIVTDLQTNNIVFASGTDYRIIGTNAEPNLICQIIEATPTITRTYNNSAALNATLGGSTAYNTGVKVGVAWSAAGRSIVAGGGTVATDSGVMFGSSPTSITVSGGTARIYAYYRRIAIWDSRLADATLDSMTDPATTDYTSATIDINFMTGAIRKVPTIYDFTSTTRASTGYSKTSAGLLTNFGVNVPRITDLGLLIEGTRTNYLTNSEDMSSWSNGNVTVTTNAAVAPNGTTTMDEVDEGTSSARHIVYQNPTVSGSAGNYMAFSIFVKDVDRRYISLQLVGNSSTDYLYAYFDLQTGTVTDSGWTSAGGSGGILTSAMIESFSGGVYRITVGGIVNTTDSAFFAIAALSNSATQAGASILFQSPSYTGTNKSVYLWGGQLENCNASTPNDNGNSSSYIPTTSSAVTRAADDVAMIGSLGDAMAYPEVSFIADYHAPSMDISGEDSGRGGGIVGDNIGFDYSQVGIGPFSIQTSNDSVDLNFSYPGGRPVGDDPHRVGFSRDPSGRSLVADGGTLVTDADPTTRMSFRAPHFGRGQQGCYAFTYIRRFLIWKNRLIDATLTSYSSQANTTFANVDIDIDFTAGPTITKGALPVDYLSCSRASIGYAKKSDGTLAYFENNMLRQTDLGLLVEDSRTNLFTYSQAYVGNYSTQESTLSDNQTTAPDGRTTAGKVTDTAVSGYHRFYQWLPTNAGTNTFSVYAKAGTLNYVALTIQNVTTYTAVFDLINGVVTDTNTDGSSPTNTGSFIEAMGNGWWRCSIKKDVATGHEYHHTGLSKIAVPASYAAGSPEFNGTGSDYIYVWGHQSEVGAFPSSYIPTTSATVTRAADDVSITGGARTALKGPNFSAILAQSVTTVLNNHDNLRCLGDYDINFGGSEMLIGIEQNGQHIRTGGISAQLTTSNTFTIGTNFKGGIAADISGRSLVLDSGTVATDATRPNLANVPKLAEPSKIEIQLMRRLSLWNSRLSDATIQSRTAP